MPRKPSWFRENQVLVSYAPTCGINKDGEELFKIDVDSGQRTREIDDQLHDDVIAFLSNRDAPTGRFVPEEDITAGFAVPTYYDLSTVNAFEQAVRESWPGFEVVRIGDLMEDRMLIARGGHGSPSSDLRNGTIPYIKVSDLRAGQVNINPTNRVTRAVAEQYWKSSFSGLRPFDLITPVRTSKNIGEFSVLMPGQERVVLTKEVLVLRPGPSAVFDAFYLAWCMSLKAVRDQWRRVVFMQTNREDTGNRYKDIRIPIPNSKLECDRLAKPFREYYEGSARLRERFVDYLKSDNDHYVFLGSDSGLLDSDLDDEDSDS